MSRHHILWTDRRDTCFRACDIGRNPWYDGISENLATPLGGYGAVVTFVEWECSRFEKTPYVHTECPFPDHWVTSNIGTFIPYPSWRTIRGQMRHQVCRAPHAWCNESPMRIIRMLDWAYAPGGRYREMGPNSAEEWCEDVLRPAVIAANKRGAPLGVNLDGIAGVSWSFVDEAFGGVADLLRYPDDVVVICDEDPSMAPFIYECIAEYHAIGERYPAQISSSTKSK